MKNALSSAMVLIGTFIGAGFASGQEVWQYFGIFGKYGVLGIALSCVLLGVFTYCTADNISSMGESEYISAVCRFKLVNLLFDCYMVLIFCTMITAFGECLNQVFAFPKIYGVILIDVVAIIILYFGADGLVRLNSIVTPVIIIGIVFFCLEKNTVDVFSYNNFLTSSFLYTSYNVISMPFVMIGMRDMVSDRKKFFLCSLIFAITIFALAICILTLLKNADTSVSIPLLDTVSEKYTYAFVIVLAMSMLTTAVSNGYGVAKDKFQPIFLGIFAIVFSFFEFSFIVKYFYSLFGYMGLYILLINFYIFVKNREKPRKLQINCK